MNRYFIQRILQAAVVVILISIGSFTLLQAVPGDLVDVMSAQRADMDAEQMANLRERFGLDQPYVSQLLNYLSGLAQGDFGYSYRTSQTVLDAVLQRLPTTALLVFCSVCVSVFLGTFAGVMCARHAHGPIDVLVSMVVLVFYATPVFLSGLVGILIFGVKLKLLPITGLITPGVEMTPLELIVDLARHLVLPVAALATFYTAIYARLSRASMLQVLGEDYIRTAYAKGLASRNVIIGHALRNALLPVATMVGLQIGELMGGAVLVETIFGLPGVGRLAFEAVFARDYPLVLGILLICSFTIVVVNLLIDFLYTLLDPRVELTK